MTRRNPRLAQLVALYLSLGSIAPVSAQVANTHTFDLPPQSLAEALRSIGNQTGVNVMFEPRLVKGLNAPALRATATTTEAIQTLLKGTQLNAVQTARDSILIEASERSSDTMRNLVRLRLAQANGAEAGSDVAETASKGVVPPATDAGYLGETVTVVGSWIRTNEDPEAGVRPVQVVTAKELNQSSGDHVGDFLRKLPINTGYSDNPMNDEYGGGNSSINLRGIGSQYSLALIDGRRFAGESMTADVGALPSVAIEGLDILTGGASAIYGSEAVAGVLNMRLKKHFEGAEFHASYGDSSRRDAQTTRVATLFGVRDEKFSFTASIEQQDRQGFTRADRELTATRDFRPYGGVDLRSCCVGMPQIIYRSSDGGATPLSIDVTRFSEGYYSGNLSEYVPYNRELQAFTTSEWSTYPPQNQTSGHWYADYSLLDDRMVFFTEGYANRRQQKFVSTLDRPTLNVPASNPYNPFGEDVRVIYLAGDVPRLLYKIDTVSYMAAAGVQGALGDYNYEVSFSKYHRRLNNRGYNDLDADALQAAVQRTDALAFNPFGYYANSPEQLALVQPDQPSGDKEIGKNWVATAKVDGKLFDWYAGQAKFALAYEHRELGYDYEPLWSSRVINYWFDGTGYVSESRKRDVDAVSGELRLPLFDGDSESFVHSAEMTAAIRYERYNDFGSSTVSQFAGKLGLLEDSILIRASYAESFLAPALADLQRQTRTVLNSNVWYDPFFNSVVPVTVIFGGNPNLRPEQGKSWNIGVVYRPRDMQGLLLTMDYWRLQIDDLIATPNIGAILLGNSLSGSLTRDPVTNLPTVDTRVANGGTRNVEGVDFQARYGWDTGVGAFNVSLGGMYFTRFEEQGNSGVTLDYLGRYSIQFGAMPELRTTFGVDWAHRGFDANVVARWMSGYTDRYGTLVNRQVGSYYTVDTQAGYEFQSDNGLLRGMRIYAGLENALDADLPFVMGSTDGWDRSLADLRGRYYYFGMSKAFK